MTILTVPMDRRNMSIFMMPCSMAEKVEPRGFEEKKVFEGCNAD